MKKYLIGSLAIALAIVSFAFVPRFGTETGLGCGETVYYFPTTAASCNLVSSSNVSTVLDVNNDSNPQTIPTETELKTAAQAPFGCQSTIQTPCAVGYTINQIESVLSNPADPNSQRIWRVKAGQHTSFRCCVKLVKV